MPTLQKPKSPRGTSGPGETPDLEELTPALENETIPEPLDKSTPGSVDPPTAAVAVVDSGEPAAHRYSATDAKLATRMSREIAQHLGLAGKSRSVRI